MTAPEPAPVVPLPAAPAPWWAQYAKSLLALAGVTPPATVFAILAANGVHVAGWLSVAVTVLLGVAAVLFGPKNAPKS